MNSTLQVGSTPVIHRKSTRFLTYRCRSSDTFLSDCRVRSKENRNHLRSWIQLEREIFIPGLSQWQPHLTVAHQVRESEGIRGMNKFIINMQTYDLKACKICIWNSRICSGLCSYYRHALFSC